MRLGLSNRLSRGMNVVLASISDKFFTDRSAGSVDGTACEPRGTRNVVDVGSNISIASGVLNIASGTGIWGETTIVFGL